MKADYIYKNTDDTKRIRIYRRYCETSEIQWDFDVFGKDGSYENFASEAGDSFSSKKEAKKEAEYQHGKITSIGNVETVTEGWD